MNYSEIQSIWDDQNTRALFAFDAEVLEREVMKESKSSRFHLRSFEHVMSALLVGLSVMTGVDTYRDGELFQIGSILIMLCGAALIFFQGHRAELKLRGLGEGVVAHIETGIVRTRRMIGLIRNSIIGFCCYFLYDVVIRAVVYDGFVQSKEKLIIAVPALILAGYLMRREVKKVHEKRLAKLEALSEKLSECD